MSTAEEADDEQRKCMFIMWRGNVTGNLVTCGICDHCQRAEAMRSGVVSPLETGAEG